MAKKVTKIEAIPEVLQSRKRVAAYARVSSGKEAMLNSLSAQVSFYSELIQHRPEWEFAGVYADEALTGTKQDRPEFQRLMTDCEAGLVDMVITKAISRFARNTVTTLEYVRKLREKGISVYFEEENIDTLSEGGELMLTVLSAFAQEQSYNVSEDCKWRIKRQFEKGEMPMCQQRLYGYRRKPDGDFEIVPEEAEVIRSIFTRYLEGAGIMTLSRETGLTQNRVRYILSNERMVGDLLLQKSYVDNHINKQKIINRGEKKQIYVHDNHIGIVDRETFEAVQIELKNRAIKFKATNEPQKSYIFSSKILCGICDHYFKRRTNAKNISWQCGKYLEDGKKHCSAKQIPEIILSNIVGNRDFKKITAYPNNRIIVEFTDGETVDTTWKDRSRSESWTPEMKEKARQKALERRNASCQQQQKS
ncbi:MAG: recombinase family protein [Firmicutes bacterium]|nr:recombinase family protein [Bacillota bacterium]